MELVDLYIYAREREECVFDFYWPVEKKSREGQTQMSKRARRQFSGELTRGGYMKKQATLMVWSRE